MNTLKIFTDGSCEPNPGYGGWCAIIAGKPSEQEVILLGNERDTTNNRMEFMAALESLRWMEIRGHSDAIIHSDSQLLVNSMTTWVWGWEKKGWRKAIKNTDLIQPMHELQKKMRIQWNWIRGHNGHPMNERADQLAGKARAEYAAEKEFMRRKTSPKPWMTYEENRIQEEASKMDREFDAMFRA